MSTPLIDIPNRHSDKLATHSLNTLPAAVLTYTAGGAIQPGRIVVFDSPANTVIQATSDTGAFVGVYVGDVAAAAGDIVQIAVDGLVEVAAGGAVTQGAQLSANSSGQAAAAAAADVAWGVALQSAANANDLIKARIGPRVLLA